MFRRRTPIGPARPLPGPRPLTADEQATIDEAHRILYARGPDRSQGALNLTWLGYLTTKMPADLVVYQEIVVETRPDLIVESGTRYGGTTLFLAGVLDALGAGRVVSIDTVRDPHLPVHPRITYITASSLDPSTVERVHTDARGRRTMVILDSLHSAEHVGAELAAYHDLVSPGCYLIVEDSNVNGHPVLPDFGPGPGEAVTAFLEGTGGFEVDRSRERFLISLNPGGYLRRVSR